MSIPEHAARIETVERVAERAEREHLFLASSPAETAARFDRDQIRHAITEALRLNSGFRARVVDVLAAIGGPL